VKTNYKIVVIGGSAGSFNLIRKILSSLPGDFSLPIVMCFHRLKDKKNGFVESLEVGSKIKIIEPFDKSSILPGIAYLAPANYHLLVEPSRTFALSTDEDVNFSRPSIDMTFESVGAAYYDNMIGILLSGANSDGAQGLYAAHKKGAYTIIQDPNEASFKAMPGEVLKYYNPDKILTVEEIIEFLCSIQYK
jgi:two-component system chemotaxis response regulator CheB